MTTWNISNDLVEVVEIIYETICKVKKLYLV